MEKYFLIISLFAIATTTILLLIQVLFVKWTDKLFNINKINKPENKKEDEKK
ncbi:MAG: hypothetical protein QME35_06500 [Thermoanaerobacteraceae bacterium]|nr:hypothetical protein [Thermoanaerobacteraceae bacterium]